MSGDMAPFRIVYHILYYMLDIRKNPYGARVAIALGETNVGLTNTYVLWLM